MSPALIKTGPTIFQSPIVAQKVIDSGFNLIARANNHVMDFGAKGLTQTLEYFQKHNIHTEGAGFSFESAYGISSFIDNNGKLLVLWHWQKRVLGFTIHLTYPAGMHGYIIRKFIR
jgi:hypothetical protein